MTGFDGRVAVVTGGSAGIGLGIAAALGGAGARVAIWSRRESVAEHALHQLKSSGVQAIAVGCDVGDEEQVQRATASTRDAFGRIDIMVANAGASGRAPLCEMELENWEAVIRTNLTGAFLAFRAGARDMIARNEGGALLAIGSVAAVRGQPELAHYAAAKAGLGGLVRTLAVELAPHHIRCNVLAPGFTANSRIDPATAPEETRRVTSAAIPAGRWGSPDDIGAAALYLADPTLAYHTGATVFVDGGLSIMSPQVAAGAVLRS
jgi:NAD(P)-dependent dehydrogenase (short-subunit alcohol dehydrogenase family)